MLTLQGIYHNGKILLDEVPVEQNKDYKVLVTFVEEVAPHSTFNKRVIGGLKGKIWMSDDFNEPLDDLKDYM